MSIYSGESCLGCLEHCKQSHGKTRKDMRLQSFFIVATSKQEFMIQLVSAISRLVLISKDKAITLVDPSGKQWNLDLSLSTLSYTALSLQDYFYKEGNVLVFSNVQNALFTFKAFEKDGCVFHMSNTHDKSSFHKEHPELQEQNQKQEGSWNNASRRGMHKSGFNTLPLDSLEIISVGDSVSECEENHDQEVEWQGMSEKRRRRVEVEVNFESEWKKRTEKPEFRVTLKRVNIDKRYMNIPREIGQNLGLDRRESFVTIISGSKEWKVKLLKGHGRWRLSAGWKNLVQGCRMKAGDECGFTLVDPHKLIFKLQVCRS